MQVQLAVLVVLVKSGGIVLHQTLGVERKVKNSYKIKFYHMVWYCFHVLWSMDRSEFQSKPEPSKTKLNPNHVNY